jgi:chromosome segregation ATPase
MLLLTAEPSLAARSIIELPVEVEPIAPEIQALSQWIDARRAEIAALRESERRQARSRRVYRARLRKLVVVHQREAVRADALQARLDALEARAVDELVEDEDDPAETFVLTRSLAAAEDEIEHLRARLLALGEVEIPAAMSEQR